MKTILTILLLAGGAAFAQLQPDPDRLFPLDELYLGDCRIELCHGGTNFSIDLLGEPDSRPGTWGRAAGDVRKIKFDPPPSGYRIRIVRAHGDFVMWPRGSPPDGTAAGALLGLQTTGPEGSVRADWLADNTMLYVQLASKGETQRAPIDFRTDALLEPDNVLVVKTAVWLNDTGLVVHMEPSLVIYFKYERTQ